MNPDYQYQPQQQPTPPVQSGTPPSGYAPMQPQPAMQPQSQPLPQPGYGFGPAPAAPGAPGAPVPAPVSTSSKKWLIIAIIFIVMTLALAGLSIWALMNYYDQKNNVDSKVSSAVALAVKEQKDLNAIAWEKAEKEPNTQFAGPDDYGRLAFKYPRTWSAYEAKDASTGNSYEAYLSPGVIPPAAADQRYALRVLIENKEYDQVVSSYERLVTKGDLKSSAVTLGDTSGTRLDGAFTKDIRGSAVILKIRDKTVTLRTDADTFMGDFNALIQTIEFNK